MEFYEVLKTRRSIRAYKADAVTDQQLQKLAEAVNLAPTACNRQPFKLLLVRDPEMRKTICANPAADIDASIAMEHLVLAAAAEGLGTCWICAFSRPQMNEALNIRAPWSAFALSPIGYAAGAPRPFTRKADGDVVEIKG